MLQMMQTIVFRKWSIVSAKVVFPILLLIAFVLIFPKGGVKVGDVPITFGYILIGLVSVAGLAFNVSSGRILRMAKSRWIALGALLPFQAITAVTIFFNGYESAGFLISLFVSFVFLPFSFFLFLAYQIDNWDLSWLFRFFRFGVFAISVYGIFLFLYKLQTGSFIEIPYLTVNVDDVGLLEGKYIDRGGVFKLISTYNNGNIYGVSVLMLLPLYALLERSLLKQVVVKSSLVLTLSRTVWIGLVLYEILYRIYVQRASVKSILGMVAGIMLALLGIFFSLHLIGVETSFLFDPNLGGRLNLLDEVVGNWYSSKPFTGLQEIVYASLLIQFGIIGLVAFILAMATPLWLHGIRTAPHADSSYKRSLALGLTIYLILAGSDGAILYIPVMAFYWFLASLLLSGQVPRAAASTH